MSKRNWVGDLTLTLAGATVLVFMAACAAGIIISEYAKVHMVYATYQRNAEDDRRRAAEEAAEACNGNDNLRLCIAEKLESHYRDQTANQDLQAQQDMAFWAAALFVSSTALTTAGLLLIWRTLLHTRAAAAHAGDAVVEARSATKAAQDAANITKDIGQAQVRAYLAIDRTSVTARSESNCLQIRFVISNIGASPAKEFNYAYLLTLYRVPLLGEAFPAKSYRRENAPQFPNFPRNGDRRIRTRDEEVIRHLTTDFRFTEEEVGYFKEGSLWVEVSIATRFKDVFGQEIAEIEHFHHLGGVPWNDEVGLSPVSYSTHSMVDLLGKNQG